MALRRGFCAHILVLATFAIGFAEATQPLGDNEWILTQRLRETRGQSYYNYSTCFDTLDRYVTVGSTSENMFRGVAKIYHDKGAGLQLEATLTDPDGVITDSYGAFVRMYNQFGAYHVAVSAPGKESDGAVFIYKNTGSTSWELQRVLQPPEGVYVTQFGRSVHFDGSQLLVSAVSRYISNHRFEVGVINSKGTSYFNEADGVSPLPCDPIFVYRSQVGRRNSTRLTLFQTIQDGPYTADFGASISLSGDTMAVGAPFRKEFLFGHGNDGDLVVNSGEVKLLDGTATYNFANVLIRSGGTLTVERYEKLRGAGGILTLKVKYGMVIEAGGAVNLTAVGHEGAPTHFQIDGLAQMGDGPGAGQAASTTLTGPASCDYDRSSTLQAIVPSGGSGSQRSNSSLPFAEACGGGASHGTHGQSGTAVQCGTSGQAGNLYGDDVVTTLYRGSGGGAGQAWKVGSGGGGGNGGGGIYIAARTITNYGTIECNGASGETGGYYSGGGGGGSGGSIVLVGIELANYGRIAALGGKGGYRAISNGFGGDGSAKGGDGGSGRIRFDFLTTRAHGVVLPAPKNITSYQGDVYLYSKSKLSVWGLKSVMPRLKSMMFIGQSVAVDGNKLALGSTQGTEVQPIETVYLLDLNEIHNQSSPLYHYRIFPAPKPTSDRSYGAALELNNNSLAISAVGSEEFSGRVYLHMGRDLFQAATSQMNTFQSEKPSAGDHFGERFRLQYPAFLIKNPLFQDDDVLQNSKLEVGDIHLYKYVRNISAARSTVLCAFSTVTANTTVNCTVITVDRYDFACGDINDMLHFSEPAHLDFVQIGTYSFQYYARDVGTHEISARYKHNRLKSFSLTVTPRVVPEHSNVTCHPTAAEAGKTVTCTIEASANSGEANAAPYFQVDVYNLDDAQLLTKDTPTKLGVFRTPPSNFISTDPQATDFVSTRPTVNFVRKGIYQFTFTASRPGTFAVYAAYQTMALRYPNPVIIDALPGGVSRTTSTITCPSVSSPGRTLVCIVQLRSASSITTGSAALLHNFSTSRNVAVSLDNKRMNSSVAVWANEGRFAVLVKPSRPGQLSVAVQYGSAPIAGSPASVVIAATYPQKCTPTTRVFMAWTIMNQHAFGRSDVNQYGIEATQALILDGQGLCDAPFI